MKHSSREASFFFFLVWRFFPKTKYLLPTSFFLGLSAAQSDDDDDDDDVMLCIFLSTL
jgi:hypothetical protein